jgi:hypothetical protein
MFNQTDILYPVLILFIIIFGILYLFEPQYILDIDINGNRTKRYDKILLYSLIISIILTIGLLCVSRFDNIPPVTSNDIQKTNTNTNNEIKTPEEPKKPNIQTYNEEELLNPNMVMIYGDTK